MKSPIRVTVSLDEHTYEQSEQLKNNLELSQSELIRRALRFYYENQQTITSGNQSRTQEYNELLSEGEHIILDVDHWQLFLNIVESSAGQAEFWNTHRDIARSHAEQLCKKVTTPEALLRRLETCNFFKISASGNIPHEYTLLTGPGPQRRFIREFLEETFSGMGFEASIKEDYSKLRIILKDNA